MEETRALGEAWGRAAQPGLVIGLSGDLGVGKTVFVKGLAIGLGIAEKISSPTFSLVNEYQSGRLPLFHLDLYRLDTRQQIISAGLEEYLFQSRGVTVAEWIERWTIGEQPVTGDPSKIRLVRIEQTSENERSITYEDTRS
jgi:tRNA threonylcarbamoyladenosine biosynthesis protein TsaE